MRSWSLSGHFHETYMHDLIHINEALSGLPVDVSFISFDDVKEGILDKFDVVINAGAMGSAWSGGEAWKDDKVVESLTRWVYEGGTFIGVGEPSAVEGYDTTFRMSHILGVDKNIVDRVCHGQWNFEVDADCVKTLVEGAYVPENVKCHLTDGNAKVMMAKDNNPLYTINEFGKGHGVYMSGFEVNNANTRMLLNIILEAGKEDTNGNYLTDNADMECAFFPESRTLIVINNSETVQECYINTEFGTKTIKLEAFDTLITTI